MSQLPLKDNKNSSNNVEVAENVVAEEEVTAAVKSETQNGKKESFKFAGFLKLSKVVKK